MFTIDTDNNITAHAELPEGADASQSFTTQKELAKLTADWPASRLIDTWNSFAGVAPFDDLKPVKKFTDRKSAVARIWNALQRLAGNVAPPVAPVAPKAKGSTKKATSPKKAARAKEGAKKARDGSKKAEVIELMRRKQGATLPEIMKFTGWQAHTVRGFISIAGSKQGLKIESLRGEDKVRTYRIS
jgi:Protein of unknown function (DUF3489)